MGNKRTERRKRMDARHREEYEAATAELMKAKAENRVDKREELSVNHERLSAVTADLESTQMRYEAMKKAISKTRKQLEEVQAQLNVEKKDHAQAVEACEKEKADKVRAVSEIAERERSTIQENQKIRAELTRTREAHEAEKQARQQAAQDAESHREVAMEAQNKAVELKQRAEKLDAEIDELRKQAEGLHKAKADLAEQSKSLDLQAAEVIALREDLSEMKKIRETQILQIEALTARIAELKAANGASQLVGELPTRTMAGESPVVTSGDCSETEVDPLEFFNASSFEASPFAAADPQRRASVKARTSSKARPKPRAKATSKTAGPPPLTPGRRSTRLQGRTATGSSSSSCSKRFLSDDRSKQAAQTSSKKPKLQARVIQSTGQPDKFGVQAGGTFVDQEDISLYHGKDLISSGILFPQKGAVLELRPGEESLNMRVEVRTAEHGVISAKVKPKKSSPAAVEGAAATTASR